MSTHRTRASKGSPGLQAHSACSPNSLTPLPQSKSSLTWEAAAHTCLDAPLAHSSLSPSRTSLSPITAHWPPCPLPPTASWPASLWPYPCQTSLETWPRPVAWQRLSALTSTLCSSLQNTHSAQAQTPACPRGPREASDPAWFQLGQDSPTGTTPTLAWWRGWAVLHTLLSHNQKPLAF